jgi:hypothetical protein
VCAGVCCCWCCGGWRGLGVASGAWCHVMDSDHAECGYTGVEAACQGVKAGRGAHRPLSRDYAVRLSGDNRVLCDVGVRGDVLPGSRPGGAGVEAG